MTWRIVTVSKSAKLELKLNQMVIRDDEIKRVNISEMSVLIIENTAVAMTAALLCELSKQKIKIIFCDEKRNPYGELVPYYGSHDTSEKVRDQMKWSDNTKGIIWTAIVKEKISQQKKLLEEIGSDEAPVLGSYLDNVEFNDSTNREGHAAKVYFRSLFGSDFSRDVDCTINSCLNYGYSILLSAVNREITSMGYITQLGIFHDNVQNRFNLGSDIMEPIRPFVDRRVMTMNAENFGPEEKKVLMNVLNDRATVEGKSHYLNNAIKIYVKSVFDALSSNDPEQLLFCKYETQIHETDCIL